MLKVCALTFRRCSMKFVFAIFYKKCTSPLTLEESVYWFWPFVHLISIWWGGISNNSPYPQPF
jgi:hypothetical protein